MSLLQTLIAEKLSGSGDEGGGGGSVTVDAALSASSENPVQNKIINAALNQKGTYTKPSGGIPASDLAAGVIPDISGKANAADVYTKTEINQKLVGAMDYKGTKAAVSALPTSGNKTGDVWHITADGSEWAWNGSAWEELGTAVDLSGYRTASAQDAIDSAQDTAIAAKYTKPSGGIPDSDIASAATWNAKGTYSKPSGGIPKTDLASAVRTSLGKADTALQQHQSLAGYATETYVQQQIAAIPDELPTVSSTDNGKFLRVVSGAWAAQAVPAAESNSFGGDS
jgi:hypothetical protein